MNPSGCADCGKRVVALNSAVVPWAANKTISTSPITVVDCYTGFDTSKDTADGVHPNSGTGMQKLANSWYGSLVEVLQSW